MQSASNGDRVQILCASWSSDGTQLESDQVRTTPYWVRAGVRTAACDASEAVVGMRVGDLKTLTVEPPDARAVTLEIKVIAIKSRPAAG